MLSAFFVNAQILPKEGKEVNYRLVPFSFPRTGAAKYRLEIAKTNSVNLDSFNAKVFKKVIIDSNKSLVELPSFDTWYGWRVVSLDKDKKETTGDIHLFKTGCTPHTDTNFFRLWVKKKALKYKDAYVFCDVSKVLYNMKGEPVWYLPVIKGVLEPNVVVRDLKMSPDFSITLLANDKPVEIDYDGLLMWRPPTNSVINQNDSNERYHHEFTKLKSRNYMVLGHETVFMDWVPKSKEDSILIPQGQPWMRPNPEKMVGDNRLRNFYGTVIEYNFQGEIKWHWRSSTYYKQVDFRSCKTGKPLFDIHQNSFYFDEKRGNIYTSFKNIAQIVKIKYSGAQMSNIIGNIYYPGLPCPDSALFWDQHGIKVTENGEILVFNNNTLNLNRPPSVVLLHEDETNLYTAKKVWEYVYPINLNGQKRSELTNGGNVVELPDHSIFVNYCSPYSNVFIVNKKKELVWDAEIQHKNTNTKQWVAYSSYRCSFISSQSDFEKMAWRNLKHYNR